MWQCDPRARASLLGYRTSADRGSVRDTIRLALGALGRELDALTEQDRLRHSTNAE